MNTGISLFLFLALSFSIATKASLADDKNGQRTLASVTRVAHPNHSPQGKVTLSMTIHSPNRLRGVQFIVVVDSVDRAEVRAEFPIGSLQTLGLPAKFVGELKPQLETFSHIQKQLDVGTDPHAISSVFLIPAVESSELTAKSVAFNPNVNQDEQREQEDGGDTAESNPNGKQ